MFFCGSLHAGQSAPTKLGFQSVTLEYERSGIAVPHWRIEAQADGSATYTEFSLQATPGSPTIHIGASTLQSLVAALDTVRDGKCETRAKNLASMGKKTLTYQSGATQISCSFNYSDNQALNAATDALLATVATLQAGGRLAQKHRFDRLGLDAELDTLNEEVKNGRAADVVNIAPVLRSIADDDRVMERVQRKATRLLQDAGATSAPSVESAR